MKEVDIEVQNNEDGVGYGFENPEAEPLKYRTRAERKAREEKNRRAKGYGPGIRKNN